MPTIKEQAREHVSNFCDTEGGILEPETRAWAESIYCAAAAPREELIAELVDSLVELEQLLSQRWESLGEPDGIYEVALIDARKFIYRANNR